MPYDDLLWFYSDGPGRPELTTCTMSRTQPAQGPNQISVSTFARVRVWLLQTGCVALVSSFSLYLASVTVEVAVLLYDCCMQSITLRVVLVSEQGFGQATFLADSADL